LPANAHLIITTLNDIITLNAFDKKEAAEKIGANNLLESPLFQNLGGIALLAVVVILALVILALMIKFCKQS